MTDNELIAEFMGMKHRKGYGPLTGETYDEVKQTSNANWQSAYFHKSWDWLMPVVEKIMFFAYVKIENGQCMISVNGTLVSGVVNGSNIENTYRACVEYIKSVKETTDQTVQ